MNAIYSNGLMYLFQDIQVLRVVMKVHGQTLMAMITFQT